MKDSIVIAGMARTPIGGMLGDLSSLSAAKLGKTAIAAAVQRSTLPIEAIEGCIMGCVLSAGQGQAPARQAALGAGLLESCESTTVNKMCGSGMKAVMLAHDAILAGSNQILVAGGMESMSNVPYLIPKARAGYRLGHGQLYDSMFLDGLEDAYDTGKLMGVFAEQAAQTYQLSREAQDEFAVASTQRAQEAIREGKFSAEITPVTLLSRAGEIQIDTDEQPAKARLDKIPQLKPAFSPTGTVTAANSSSISDGAAGLVLLKESEAHSRGIIPLARIVAHSTFAHAPSQFTSAPVFAIQRLLKKCAWDINTVDLFEINEAFAVVTLIAMQELQIPHEKVNVHGGACALGHPIGASGARVLVTLISALKQYGLKRGIAALCIGGGEATAIAIEVNN